MQILITNVVDTGLIIGVIAAFLLIDIIAKNKLEIGIRDIGADLAIGAIAIQLAFIITLLRSQEMEYFYSNILFAACFAVIWAICLWLPLKNDVLRSMFSYTLGAFALSLSILYVLGTADITGIIILLAASLLLSLAGFLFADYLSKERIEQGFLDITKDLNTYQMNEDYRKTDSGKSAFDPLQPVIDIIRGALRNNDELTAIKGIRALAALGATVLLSEGKNSLVLRHLNSHLYRLGTLTDEENKNSATKEIVNTFGDLGTRCAERNMESTVLQIIEHMHNLFTIYKVRNDTDSESRISLVKSANTFKDVYSALAGSQASTPRHGFVMSAGRIGQAAARQKMIEPVEKSVSFLKSVALDAAANKDINTLEHVRKALVGIAAAVKENRLEAAEKHIIIALRDICIKAVQESSDRKRDNALRTVIAALRETGDIFGEHSYPEVAGCFKDIGITAARKHSDDKVSAVILHIEHLCLCAADRNLDEEASASVNALMQVCEASIREQMVDSTAMSSKTLAGLSQRESLAVLVNDAVFEIGKYRELDREMFALFEKTYRNSGGQ
ncbi:MAG: hypothetical protein PWP63_959 [Methanolobus sp.]|nr:hypothetical protein [Methanolobus sp.]